MKNKQLSPTHRLFSRPQKQTVGSHNSGSTFETSDQKLIIKSPSNNPKLAKTQSQTISILRKELKNIKSEVTKLIEEGFVKATPPSQWLQSSANMSSISKSSKISAVVIPDFYGQSDTKTRKSQAQRNSFVFSYEQLINLRQECENLRNRVRIEEEKQVQILSKQKELLEEVKALRKCKQQLTKCIEILQASLLETNQKMKIHLQQTKRLKQQLQRTWHENRERENGLNQIHAQKNRLLEQVEYRKAENNELIRIIQFKESEVQQLRINYSSQMRAMEIQYRRSFQENNRRIDDNCERQLRARSANPYQQNSVDRSEMDRLQNQVQSLRAQVQNRERVMVMMLNDIKAMDKQLLATDQQHQELLRCRSLIEELNQNLVKMEMKRISSKYKYC